MLWGGVLSQYVLGDGGGELGRGGVVGVGVEEVAGEGDCCLEGGWIWDVRGFGIGIYNGWE